MTEVRRTEFFVPSIWPLQVLLEAAYNYASDRSRANELALYLVVDNIRRLDPRLVRGCTDQGGGRWLRALLRGRPVPLASRTALMGFLREACLALTARLAAIVKLSVRSRKVARNPAMEELDLCNRNSEITYPFAVADYFPLLR